MLLKTLYVFYFSYFQHFGENEYFEYLTYGRLHHDHLQLCHSKHFIFHFPVLKNLNFERFNHDDIQLCHFSFFIFSNILILKDSIMIIFKYVIENLFSRFSILKYPNFERSSLLPSSSPLWLPFSSLSLSLSLSN